MKLNSFALLCLLFLTLSACDKGEEAPQGTVLSLVAGQDQTALRNAPLDSPVIVRLTDLNDNPVEGAVLSIALREGSGSLVQNSFTTDVNGEARIEWTLGNGRDNVFVVGFEGDDKNGAATALEVVIAVPYEYALPEEKEDGLSVAHAADLGFDVSRLERMIDAIDDGQFKEIHSVAIMKEGKLVLQQQFFEKWPSFGTINDIIRSRGDKHLSFSVTKSVTSALIGIAVEEGLIELNAPLYSYFDYPEYENWTGEKMAITIHDALTMRTGLDCSEFGRWEEAPDPSKYTLDLPLVVSPGGTFNYCTEVSNLLGEIIERQSGLSLQVFANIYLFSKLGIRDVEWWIVQERATAGSSLYWSTRDMLKFGQLFLNNGRWNGLQVVPEAWVAQSTESLVDTGWVYDYALHWWKTTIQAGLTQVEVTAAIGVGGQRIFILHELDMVVVFTGGNFNTAINGVDELTIASDILREYVLTALQ